MCRMLARRSDSDNIGVVTPNNPGYAPRVVRQTTLLEKAVHTMLITMPEHSQGEEVRPQTPGANPMGIDYRVDPLLVADALIRHLDTLANQRAEYRRALIRSVEVLETPDGDDFPVAI